MKYQEFIDKWNNKGCDFDNFYGFQCMDLAHQYAVEVVGKDFAPAPAAKDVWNQNIDGYDKVENTPIGVPEKGDIIIWGIGVGAYGHIAVFDNGDANKFVSFDQNWPLNSVCHFQNHNYNGVLGWFHPKDQAPQLTGLDATVGYKPTFEGQTISVNGVTYHSERPDGNNLVWVIVPPHVETPVETQPEAVQPIVETSTPTVKMPQIPTVFGAIDPMLPVDPPKKEIPEQSVNSTLFILLSRLWELLKRLLK